MDNWLKDSKRQWKERLEGMPESRIAKQILNYKHYRALICGQLQEEIVAESLKAEQATSCLYY